MTVVIQECITDIINIAQQQQCYNINSCVKDRKKIPKSRFFKSHIGTQHDKILATAPMSTTSYVAILYLLNDKNTANNRTVTSTHSNQRWVDVSKLSPYISDDIFCDRVVSAISVSFFQCIVLVTKEISIIFQQFCIFSVCCRCAFMHCFLVNCN